MFQKLLVPYLCFAFAMAVPSATATIVQIPSAFSSELTESWESFPVGFLTDTPPASISVMNGFATATGASLVTYIPGQFGPNHFGLGPFTARVYDGNQGFGVSRLMGIVTFEFSTPIVALGGFWGIASDTEPVTVTFLDGQGNSLGQTQFFYSRPNDDGTLEWHGWATDVPAAKVLFSGLFFVNDSLRVSKVPEPTTLLLLALGLAASASTRIRRHGARSHFDD